MSGFIRVTRPSGLKMYLNIDHITGVREYDGASAILSYGGTEYYEVKEDLEEVMRRINAELSRTAGSVYRA